MRSLFFLLPLFLLLFNACSKPAEPTPTPTPNPPAPPVTPSIKVDGKWECEIDGKKYSGTVDTSFTLPSNQPGSHPDTLFYCTGTGSDKNSNIYFALPINRFAFPKNTNNTAFGGVVAFDTCAPLLLGAAGPTQSQIVIQIDSFVQNRYYATFGGTFMDLWNGGALHTVTNGKLSCTFNQGTAEEKFFTFTDKDRTINGYIQTAQLVTNTLIIDGRAFSWNGGDRFKLQIRTGGTIKSGIYKSENGDVALQHFVPVVYRNFVTDTFGSMSVTINSVNGNIVEGVFSGINAYTYTPISNGKFKCRVKNYTPEPDSPYKWQFGINESNEEYAAYAGNMIKAIKTQDATRYYLTLNGNSDNGTSTFKIVLSSLSPISANTYQIRLSPNKIDSMYFSSNTKLWNGNTTFMQMTDYADAYCRIDSIDNKEVSGVLYGRITRYFNAGSGAGNIIKKASFKAAF